MKRSALLVFTLPSLFMVQGALSQTEQVGPARSSMADMPDCNTVTVVGSPCRWPNGNPPGLQKYLGQIDLPKSDHSGTTLVNFTEPFPESGGAHPAPGGSASGEGQLGRNKRVPFAIGGTYSLQSETLDFSPPSPNAPGYVPNNSYVPNNHVSDGFTLLAKRQWSDWRGIEVRAEIIRYDVFVDSLSLNPGQNHTYSITAGPNVQHRFGRLTPYFTPQIGYLYQFVSGVKVAGALGLDLNAGRHVTVRLGDFEYGYAAAQFVQGRTDPLHGREKLSTGLYWNF